MTTWRHIERYRYTHIHIYTYIHIHTYEFVYYVHTRKLSPPHCHHCHHCMPHYLTKNKYNYLHIYILCTYSAMWLHINQNMYILCTRIDAPYSLLSWLQAWLNDYKYIEICAILRMFYLHRCSARVIVMTASATISLHTYKYTHIYILCTYTDALYACLSHHKRDYMTTNRKI